jgi:hypothetical protein
MFETLKRLYDSQRLNQDGLKNAVAKEWITPEQYYDITKESYVA